MSRCFHKFGDCILLNKWYIKSINCDMIHTARTSPIKGCTGKYSRDTIPIYFAGEDYCPKLLISENCLGQFAKRFLKSFFDNFRRLGRFFVLQQTPFGNWKWGYLTVDFRIYRCFVCRKDHHLNSHHRHSSNLQTGKIVCCFNYC